MKRPLLRSSAFVRAARKTVKKRPDVAQDVQTTLEQLAKDAFHPQLRTHKLKGTLAGSWACSVRYDLGIVFRFVEHEGAEAICWRPWELTKKCIEG